MDMDRDSDSLTDLFHDEETVSYYKFLSGQWLTFNLVDCIAGRLMSLLRFLKMPGGGEPSPMLPTPQSSAEKQLMMR